MHAGCPLKPIAPKCVIFPPGASPLHNFNASRPSLRNAFTAILMRPALTIVAHTTPKDNCHRNQKPPETPPTRRSIHAAQRRRHSHLLPDSVCTYNIHTNNPQPAKSTILTSCKPQPTSVAQTAPHTHASLAAQWERPNTTKQLRGASREDAQQTKQYPDKTPHAS